MEGPTRYVRRPRRWPDPALRLVRQANRARDAGDPSRAATLYARARRRKPDDAPIHVQAGNMYKESGDPPPPEDIVLFLRRWKDWLADDPSFHPRMNHHRFDLQPGHRADDWFVRWRAGC